MDSYGIKKQTRWEKFISWLYPSYDYIDFDDYRPSCITQLTIMSRFNLRERLKILITGKTEMKITIETEGLPGDVVQDAVIHYPKA